MSVLCLLCLGPFNKSVFDLRHGAKKADFGDIKLSTDREMTLIGNALHPKVVTLNFSSCQFLDVGALWAAQWLQQCPLLREVALGGNGITDEGAVALAAALPSCKQLRKLLLGVNSIGDRGGHAIAVAIPYCPQLVTLGLNANRITDLAAISFANGIPYCRNLLTLNLERNDISNSVMLAIVASMNGVRTDPPLEGELIPNLVQEEPPSQHRHIDFDKLNDVEKAVYKMEKAKLEFERKLEQDIQAKAKLDKLLDGEKDEDLPVAVDITEIEEPPRPLVQKLSF